MIDDPGMVGSGARRLDRFAKFLHDRHPTMAQIIAVEILNRTRIISEHSQLGRPIDGREDYRELVLSVLNTTYVFRYGYDGERLVVLRVFQGREQRDT